MLSLRHDVASFLRRKNATWRRVFLFMCHVVRWAYLKQTLTGRTGMRKHSGSDCTQLIRDLAVTTTWDSVARVRSTRGGRKKREGPRDGRGILSRSPTSPSHSGDGTPGALRCVTFEEYRLFFRRLFLGNDIIQSQSRCNGKNSDNRDRLVNIGSLRRRWHVETPKEKRSTVIHGAGGCERKCGRRR